MSFVVSTVRICLCIALPEMLTPPFAGLFELLTGREAAELTDSEAPPASVYETTTETTLPTWAWVRVNTSEVASVMLMPSAFH